VRGSAIRAHTGVGPARVLDSGDADLDADLGQKVHTAAGSALGVFTVGRCRRGGADGLAALARGTAPGGPTGGGSRMDGHEGAELVQSDGSDFTALFERVAS
jgi:hypothetical protein